jgi:hypothetical protein
MFNNQNQLSKSTRIFITLMLFSYALSLILPVGHELAVAKRGYSFFILGSSLRVGINMLPANVFFLLGVQSIYEGSRLVTFFCGLSSLIIGLISTYPLADSTAMYHYPAFWFWITAFALLLLQSIRPVLKAISKPNHRR